MNRPATVTPSLLTDRYEFSMLTTLVNSGMLNHRGVFEAFARDLPAGRRYGMVGGIGRLLELIETFTPDPDEVQWLVDNGVIDAATADYLRTFTFTGDIRGLREGDVYFPHTPVLTVDATLGEGFLLETLILSVLNHDTAITSTAARMVTAAQGRPIIEMGSRRTHEQAAVAAARAAYVAGFAATSNLAAARLFGVPSTGTAAHAFTLAHTGVHANGDTTGETAAFISQMTAHGVDTTLLVDTYETTGGLHHAVAAARTVRPGANGPAAVRIDSGDLGLEARAARVRLDALGAIDTKITVTSDMDEHSIAALLADGAPVDGFGVGTKLVTANPARMVYKLVSRARVEPDGTLADGNEMTPVAKKASGKASHGGTKTVWRTYDAGGRIASEVHTVDNASMPVTDAAAHLAQVPLVSNGRVVHRPTLDQARLHARHALASLPAEALRLDDGAPAITPTVHTARVLEEV